MFGKPVRNAKVGIEGTAERVPTDAQGRFILQAPMGASIVVDKDSYQTSLATVTSGNVGDIVMLNESMGETIELKGEVPPPAPGAAQLDRTELQRVPGTGGDIVRALTVMPGVVNLQIPLGYSGVVIRGASPQDSKVLIDGFEVPVLFHSIGFRAITPAETIAGPRAESRIDSPILRSARSTNSRTRITSSTSYAKGSSITTSSSRPGAIAT